MPEEGHRLGLPGVVGGLVLAGGLAGALLLFVAEFTTLYEVKTASSVGAVKSVATGSNHAYAMAVIAVVAAAFTIGVWRTGGRPGLLAIGALGLIALLLSLVGDLPDAHRSDLLIGSPTTHLQLASTTPSAGMYMETLGAVVLIITCVSAFILLGPPARSSRQPAHG